MLSRPSDEMVPPQPMAAIKGLLGIIPPKSPAFRSDNATLCVAWRVAGSEQAGDLGIVVRMQEACAADDTMFVRQPPVVSPRCIMSPLFTMNSTGPAVTSATSRL